MKKVSLIDGRFSLGQQKQGAELAFYELHRRGLFKKLNYPYELALTMETHVNSEVKWRSESQWLEKLSKIISMHYNWGNKVVTIGGDHSLGLSTVTGVHRVNPNIALVWIDAHADYNNKDTTISGNLHGMPLNGLVRGWEGISPEFEWIGDGIMDPSRVALFGLRDVDPKEQILLDYSGIAYWTMRDINERGLSTCLKELNNKINPNKELDWHVSFDLDSIDPKEFPSTGCLVEGGISFKDACAVMNWFNDGHLRSFDIVEWNPIIASSSDCDEKLVQLINQGL